MGEYLIEQILSDVNAQKSPIDGSKFPALSKDYAREKKAEGARPVPDLESTGKMLQAIDFKITSEGVKVGIFGKEAPKADGHNNLSGESSLPLRQFLPNEGEGFRGSITKGIEAIIAENLADEVDIPEEELSSVETEAQLFRILSDTFSGLSKSEIITAVSLNETWKTALRKFGLFKFL